MQSQLDKFQKDIVLCQHGDLEDAEINTILVRKLFTGQEPLSDVPCAAVAKGPDIFPYRGMQIVITENRDKTPLSFPAAATC